MEDHLCQVVRETATRCFSLLKDQKPVLEDQNLEELTKKVMESLDMPLSYFPAAKEALDNQVTIEAFIQQFLGVYDNYKSKLKELTKAFEVFFSDKSVRNNKKLQKLIEKDPEGFAPLEYFASLRNITKITNNSEMLVQAVQESSLLEFSSLKNGIRKKPTQPSSFYQLDTSQKTIKYMPSSDSVPINPLIVIPRHSRYEISFLVANSNFVCYYAKKKVQVIDIEGGLITLANDLEVKDLSISQKTNNLLVLKANSSIQIWNLDSKGCSLNYPSPDNTLEQLRWHPTRKKYFSTTSFDEVVLWKTNSEFQTIEWYKVLSFTEKVHYMSFNPYYDQIIGVAYGQGEVKVLDFETEQTLFQCHPHTYNTMIYSSLITVDFLNSRTVITSGKSQNEFTIWNWESQSQLHTLHISSMNAKKISLNPSGLIIADPQSSTLSIVQLGEVRNSLKFCSIIDYRLTYQVSLVHWCGLSMFAVCNKNAVAIFTGGTEECKREETAEQLPSVLANCVHQNMDKVSDKVNSVCNLAWFRKAIQESASGFKFTQKSIAQMEQTFQDIRPKVVPALQSVFNEVVFQASKHFEVGIKEFVAKQEELSQERQYIQSNTESKLELLDEIVKHLETQLMKSIAKLKTCEEYLKERWISLGGSSSKSNCHEEISIVLAKQNYEEAISKVVSNPRKLYSLMKLFNPEALLLENLVSQNTCFKILKQIVIFPPTETQCPELQTWLKTLAETLKLSTSQKKDLSSLIKATNSKFQGLEVVTKMLA